MLLWQRLGLFEKYSHPGFVFNIYLQCNYYSLYVISIDNLLYYHLDSRGNFIKNILFYIFFFLHFSTIVSHGKCIEDSNKIIFNPKEVRQLRLAKKLTHFPGKFNENAPIYKYPELISIISTLGSMLPAVDSILKSNPYISKFDLYQYYIDQYNSMAAFLLAKSKLYRKKDNDLAAHLYQSYENLFINIESKNRIISKIYEKGNADEPFLKYQHPQILRENRIAINGFLSHYQGERGELLATFVLPGVEDRSTSALRLITGKKNEYKFLDHYWEKIEGAERGKKRKKVIAMMENDFNSFIGKHVSFEYIFSKEIDLIRGNSSEWIEVKHLNHIVTYKSLRNQFDNKILIQTQKLVTMLKKMNMRNEIELKMFFVNCIEREAASFLKAKYNIISLGCIQN